MKCAPGVARWFVSTVVMCLVLGGTVLLGFKVFMRGFWNAVSSMQTCSYSERCATQEKWHSVHYAYALRLHQWRRAGLAEKPDDLLEALTQPDFTLTAETIGTALSGERASREYVLCRLYHAWLWGLRAMSDDAAPAPTPHWRENADFQRCSFYVYDESRHFLSPLIGKNPYPDSDFCAYVFVVYNDEVVACEVFTNWGSRDIRTLLR